MALRNKFLSPPCAPDLVDVDTYFFFRKNISIRYQNMCYNNAKFRRVLSPVVYLKRARLNREPTHQKVGKGGCSATWGSCEQHLGRCPALGGAFFVVNGRPPFFGAQLASDLPTVEHGTVQYSTVRYSTVRYSTVPCSTVQYSTVLVLYCTVRYSTVRYSNVLYGTVRYSALAVLHCTVQYIILQYSTVHC